MKIAVIPKRFFSFCINKYLDKVSIKTEVALKASKKELICVLPFTEKKTKQKQKQKQKKHCNWELALNNSVESN